MFPFPIARPQGCDIQTFYGAPAAAASRSTRTWNKPRGVSHVYMLLIGAGGGGAGPGAQGAGGGGSGAVTVWYGAAQHVPDILNVTVGVGTLEANGTASIIRGINNTAFLNASAGDAASLTTGGGGGATTSSGNFSAMGFYQSIAGQMGANASSAISSSATTFLSGGAGGTTVNNNAGLDTTANYGYVAKGGAASSGTFVNGNDANSGTFQMQPIIFGLGGGGGGGGGTGGGNAGTGGKGGIGCGGGGSGYYFDGSVGSAGGDGLVLIASW